MSELQALQRRFLAQMIAPEAAADVSAGMQAYRNAYLLRIDEALRADFDAVHQILGDDDMLALTADYLEAHPSKHPSIRWIGRSLPTYIAASTHWSRVPALADMARFEWAKSCLFDGEDSAVSGVAELQQIPPERWGEMRLELIPALVVDHFPAAVPPLWQQLNRRESVSAPANSAAEPWLLWRKELRVHWRSLDVIEQEALASVKSGANFGEICQGLAAHIDEEQIPEMAMQLLLQWCNDQIIVTFHP